MKEARVGRTIEARNWMANCLLSPSLSSKGGEGDRTVAGMGRAWRWIMVATLALKISASEGQTFSMLKSFGSLSNATGYVPQGTLVQGADGALYGTASGGEGSIAGTVFKMQPDGSGFMVLKFFTNSTEGANPMAGLAVAGNALYGTTYNGGSFDRGTIFKLNTDGTAFTVLRSFAGYPEGSNPTIPVVLDGNVLYGATSSG